MRLSIRNQFPATITAVARGEVMTTVRSRLTGGQEVTAAVTLEGADELTLAEGQPVTVLIKATELAVATGEVGNLSIRNRIPGTIEAITHGVVMTTVKIDIGGGDTLTAVITKEAAQDLGLADGDPVTALVKSTEVSLAID
jgi:molybdate transport system regulatory protein